MKAMITEVIFKKEFESKYGPMFTFHVKYDDQVAVYNSKSKDQKKFVAGQEAEFTEETKTYTDKQGNLKEYLVIKPPTQNRQSNFGKALSKEKSRYSGFAVSYAKDMAVAGRIPVTDLAPYAWILFYLMVEMDKTLET
jgi:hypothetical protein